VVCYIGCQLIPTKLLRLPLCRPSSCVFCYLCCRRPLL
jgi:hypothetical protein